MHLNFKPSSFIHKPGDLGLLEISHTLRSFSINLIALFIPIFFLQIGFSLNQVFYYFAVKSFTAVLMVLPTTKLFSLIKPNIAMNLNIPLNILFLYLIYLKPQTINELLSLGLISGAAISIYWLGFNFEFNADSNEEKLGKEISSIRVFLELSKTTAPLFGGLILSFLNFNALFIISIIILVVSGIPLVFHTSKKINFNFKSLKSSVKNLKNKYKLSIIAFGIEESTSEIIWPLFIYLFIVQSFIGLGAVTTISFLLVLLVMIVVGKLFDSKKSTLKLGSIITSLIWILKILAQSVSHVVGINMFRGVAKELVLIPYYAKINKKANKEESPINFFVINEILINLAKTFICILFTLIPAFQFQSIFIIAALTSLVYYKL